MRDSKNDFLTFLIGGSLFAAGIFLFANQVMVGSGLSRGGWGSRYGGDFGAFTGGLFSIGLGGAPGLGLLMLPFGLGVALLLADTYRKAGWLLIWACSAALSVAVLQSLFFSFRPTSLWTLLSMVIMVAGGGGLMLRSLRGYTHDAPGPRSGQKHGADATRQKDQKGKHTESVDAEIAALRERMKKDKP